VALLATAVAVCNLAAQMKSSSETFDDVFADRMNIGLDWIGSVSWWIELDWI